MSNITCLFYIPYEQGFYIQYLIKYLFYSYLAPLPTNDDHLPVTVKLLRKIDTKGNWLTRLFFKVEEDLKIFDCAIVDKLIVFVCSDKKLIIYNEDGSYKKDINRTVQIQSISVMNDTDIAVSYNREFIEIININTEQKKNTFKTRGNASAIFYQHELLYVVIDLKKIDVINLRGEITQSFAFPSQTVWNLGMDTDRLFFTETVPNILYCCDLNGKVLWKFTCHNMIGPCGVTTDWNGHVYVTCCNSQNVLVVSSDGKHHKELLTEKDELHTPIGITFSKPNNSLLICNESNGYSFLYYVINSNR